jgi:hypothetical protein
METKRETVHPSFPAGDVKDSEDNIASKSSSNSNIFLSLQGTVHLDEVEKVEEDDEEEEEEEDDDDEEEEGDKSEQLEGI